jgi:hypothetical protein
MGLGDMHIPLKIASGETQARKGSTDKLKINFSSK